MGFDVLVTVDQNIPAPANRIRDLERLMPTVRTAPANLGQGQLIRVSEGSIETL